MSETDNSYPSPSVFLTTYDVKTGIEAFEAQYKWILKLLSKMMSAWVSSVLLTRCFHKEVSPSQKTQEKALENAKRRYAQGGQKSLAEYLNRWRTWIDAGLHFKVDRPNHVWIIGNHLTGSKSSSMFIHLYYSL